MPWVQSLPIHFAWDTVDLLLFYYWQVSYLPHVAKTDQQDFQRISWTVLGIGAFILLVGIAPIIQQRT